MHPSVSGPPTSLSAVTPRAVDTPARSQAERKSWVPPLLDSVGVATLAGVLRFHELGTAPIWLDEANSVLIALGAPADLVDRLSHDAHPPLFYLLLQAWMLVVGTSETAARALPALCGIAAVLAVYLVTRSCFPRQRVAALAAATIMAVSPLQIYHAQQIRMYTLVPLLAALAFLSLERWLDTGRRRDAIAYTIVLAAGLYTHNHFLFLLPLGPAAALLTPGILGRRRALVASLASALVALILYAPWIPTLVQQSRSGGVTWIRRFWETTPPSAALWRSFEVMGVSGALPIYLNGAVAQATIPVPELWAALRVVGAVLGVGLVTMGIVTTRQDPRERDVGLRLALLLALPLVLPWVVSFVAPIYLVGRYELAAVVGYALLAGRGFAALVALRLMILAPAVAGLWLAGAGVGLLGHYRSATHPAMLEDQRTADWLRGQVGPKDTVILPGHLCGVLEYHFVRWNSPTERRCFPLKVSRHLGWVNWEDQHAVPREAGSLATQMRQVVDRGGRVFLVISSTKTPAAVNQALTDALSQHLGPPQIYAATTSAIAVYRPR